MSGGKNSRLAVHAPVSRCGISWQKRPHPRLARKLLVIPRVATNDRSIGPLDLLAADDLRRHLRAAEAAILRDARRQRIRWRYRVRRGRVRFDSEVRDAQRRLKQGLGAFLRQSSAGNVLTAPLIYSLAVPLLLADIWITMYQWICFPVYGIPRVRRRDYFVLDRYRLGYLNAIEKVNCTYCSYANGLIAYIREIAARTEQYWCPIKHGRRVRSPHQRYLLFADFGDAAGYRVRSGKLRTALAGRHRRTITFARRNGLR